MTFEAGQNFAHFKIIRKLGEGGMGEVYLAEDRKLGRNVALKILPTEFSDDPDRMERFDREAKIAAKISHPNVMAIYDLGSARHEQSGRELAYIVMEHIGGEALSDYLQKRSLNMAELLRVAEKIASGLAAAHKLNIVHRDIKTDNIRIDDHGDPKILDFGLAKPIDSLFSGDAKESTDTITRELTQEGKILGTVTYMSPEQARGETVDTRSDIFSYGILLYRMFTGEYPFEGSDKVSTLAKILEAKHAPLRLKNESVPPELERIADKCLRKDPGDRYQDTRDLVVDLRSLRRQFESGISDSTVITADDLPRPKEPRKPFLAWLTWPKLIFLGILSIILIAIIANIFDESQPARPGITDTTPTREGALAILGFANKTGDADFDWLTAGLPEILLTDLAQNGEIRLISRTRVLDCLEDRGRGITDLPGHQECVTAAKSLGAGTVLSGSFFKLGDRLRIDARLEDVETGEILLGEKVVGDDPFALVDSLTDKIAQSLIMRSGQLEAERLAFDAKGVIDDPRGFVDSVMREVRRSLSTSGVLAADRGIAEITSSSVEAYKHYTIGMQKFGLSLYDEAIEHFQQAIKIDSTFALPYMRIGMSYQFQGRQQQGMPYMSAALRFEDRLPLKEKTLLDIYADTWLRRNFDDAFIKLKVFVGNYPDDKEARTIYALFLAQIINDHKAAFAQLDTVLTLDPRYPLALESYAQTCAQLNDYEKAIDYWQRMKEYYPESPSSYQSLMGIYRRLSRYDDAIRESRELLRISPDDDVALSLLATIYILKRDFASAQDYTRRIRESHGDDPYLMIDHYRIAANLAGWKGMFKTALDHFFAALSQAKSTGDSAAITGRYYSLARHYANIDIMDSALYYAGEARKWAITFQKINYPLFMVSIDHRHAATAREMFKKYADEFKSKVPAEFWPILDIVEERFEGYCRADTATIIAGLEKLMSRPGQENTQNIEDLGRLLILAGEYERGKGILQKLISGRLETTNGFYYLRAQYHIGRANENLGNTEEAISSYREVLKYWNEPEIELDEITDTRQRLRRLTS